MKIGKIFLYIKSLCKQILSILKCFCFSIFLRDKIIFVRAWVVRHHFFGKQLPNNWGDDINIHFLELISGKKIQIYPGGRVADFFSRFFHAPIMLGIGSIVTFWNLNHMIVCGSGIISTESVKKLRGIPQKICFVRGPLTRQILLQNGMDCPVLCGDLALTLSLYYKGQTQKKNEVGIVLHYSDQDSDFEKSIRKKFPQIKIIGMRGYKKWTDVIDEITSCETILSTSLHGLIVAEAYGVKNRWIHVENSVMSASVKCWNKGWEFKFNDFFASVGKENETVTFVSSESDLLSLARETSKNWIPGKFDATKLIDALPNEFKFNGKYTKFSDIVRGGGVNVRLYPVATCCLHASSKECA